MKKGTPQKDNICIVCGAEISEIAAARTSHLRKHVRDGSLSETQDKKGKLVFKATGKDPKEKEENVHIWGGFHRKTQTFESRPPVTAKNKKDKIYIKCKECGKLSKSRRFVADQRFISIICCDKTTVFPQRCLDRIKNNGQEYTE